MLEAYPMRGREGGGRESIHLQVNKRAKHLILATSGGQSCAIGRWLKHTSSGATVTIIIYYHKNCTVTGMARTDAMRSTVQLP